jgi:hypothetical protein
VTVTATDVCGTQDYERDTTTPDASSQRKSKAMLALARVQERMASETSDPLEKAYRKTVAATARSLNE